MPSSPSSFMSLNMNIGVLLAMVVPLGGAVWTVSGWANSIEANIQQNQAQIEEVVVQLEQYIEDGEQRDIDRESREMLEDEREDALMLMLQQLLDQAEED